MKRILYCIAALAIMFFCLLWLHLRPSNQVFKQNIISTNSAQPANDVDSSATSKTPLQPVSPTNIFVRPYYIDEDHWNQLMLVRKVMLELNQPIKFYARTLDQDGLPVKGVELNLELTYINEDMFKTTNFFHMNMGDEIRKKPVAMMSEADGWIKLVGLTGESLRLKSLSKQGYLCELPNVGSFGYEAEGKHSIGYAGMEDAFDPAKGYIFHLQQVAGTNSLK